MPSPSRDPHDPLAAPSNVDAAGTSTPYGPHPHGTEQAAGGADSSPLDTHATDERPTASEPPPAGRRP